MKNAPRIAPRGVCLSGSVPGAAVSGQVRVRNLRLHQAIAEVPVATLRTQVNRGGIHRRADVRRATGRVFAPDEGCNTSNVRGRHRGAAEVVVVWTDHEAERRRLSDFCAKQRHAGRAVRADHRDVDVSTSPSVPTPGQQSSAFWKTTAPMPPAAYRTRPFGRTKHRRARSDTSCPLRRRSPPPSRRSRSPGDHRSLELPGSGSCPSAPRPSCRAALQRRVYHAASVGTVDSTLTPGAAISTLLLTCEKLGDLCSRHRPQRRTRRCRTPTGSASCTLVFRDDSDPRRCRKAAVTTVACRRDRQDTILLGLQEHRVLEHAGARSAQAHIDHLGSVADAVIDGIDQFGRVCPETVVAEHPHDMHRHARENSNHADVVVQGVDGAGHMGAVTVAVFAPGPGSSQVVRSVDDRLAGLVFVA